MSIKTTEDAPPQWTGWQRVVRPLLRSKRLSPAMSMLQEGYQQVLRRSARRSVALRLTLKLLRRELRTTTDELDELIRAWAKVPTEIREQISRTTRMHPGTRPDPPVRDRETTPGISLWWCINDIAGTKTNRQCNTVLVNGIRQQCPNKNFHVSYPFAVATPTGSDRTIYTAQSSTYGLAVQAIYGNDRPLRIRVRSNDHRVALELLNPNGVVVAVSARYLR